MSYTLFTHIISAILTLGTGSYAWFRPSQTIRHTFRLFTLLSVSSGIFLVADPTVFNKSFCLKLGLYLLFIALAEYRLDFFLKNSKVNRVTPKRQL